MTILLLAGAALIAAAAWSAMQAPRRRHAAAGTALRRGIEVETGAAAEPATVSPVVERLASASRRLTPTSMIEPLDAKVAGAGLQGQWSIDTLLAVKLALGTAGALLGLLLLLSSPGPIWFVFAFVFAFGAWYLPDIVAGQRAEERGRRIRNELPDTLDQLTIAVEAGLGFESALTRVAQQGTGPLAEELRRTLQDIKLGMGRGEALTLLGERTGVVDVRRFVAATRQSERYGVPIATVLRTQAAELRDRRRQRAEEHAMKIPVKVLFPLMFCILPTLFIVVLGPAVINYVQSGGIGG